MKIAILTPSAFENAETFVQNHITNLPFEIVVIHGGKFPHLVNENTSLIKEKLKHKILNFIKRGIGFKTNSFEASQLSKILVKEKVDLVFVEYLHVGAEVVSVCEQLKIPMAVTALGYEISRYDMIAKYETKYRKLFAYAKNIFVVSNHMRTNIKKIGCADAKIIYTPAGPSEAFLKLSPTFKSNQLLCVGRFVEKKAPHLTLLAFKEVLNKIPNAILIMAGDGPLLAVCKDIVNAFGIENSVQFVGRISPIKHQSLLEESIAFIQHSKVAVSGDSEGTPVAILEASAAGLPIVSTMHAGIPNVVKNNDTGFLVAENNVLEMAEKMTMLLNDKSLAKKMGAAGKKYVSASFTLKNHIDIITKHLTNA